MQIIRFILLILFSLSISADVLYSFDAPTEYNDGTPLPLTDIDSYIISYSINGINQPDLNVSREASSVIAPGTAGTYTARIATIVNGVRGSWSEEAICKPLAKAVIMRCEVIQ